MRLGVRRLAAAALVATALLAGWRLVHAMQAERLAMTDPARALGWHPGDPQALLGVAVRQLDQGDLPGSERSARELLAREPLEGRAFRVLGEVASRRGRRERALQLHLIASRRAPRDIPARAWLARHYLEQREFAKALAHIDFVLQTTPDRSKGITRILKQLVPLVEDEGFADALVRTLRSDPPWRGDMLRLVAGYPDANSRILQALRRGGGLSQAEDAMWLDGLMANGRWGEAYARWASHAIAPGEGLPLLYNGDFRSEPSNVGFDWRLESVPGISVRFNSGGRARDGMAQLQFLGRPVRDTGLRHPLFLFPGSYRLSMRIRTKGFRSGLGLVWRLECTGNAGVVGVGEALERSPAWKEHVMQFTVPPENCPGQVLRLGTFAAESAPPRLEGVLWVDDVAIQRVSAP